MTAIDTEVDVLRMRLNHIERRVMQIEARLSGLPLSEPILFPITARTTPVRQSQHYCNFCGKAQEEVAVLIAGPGNPLFICNECVKLCGEIVQKRLAKDKAGE